MNNNYITTHRGGTIENIHKVHAVVTDVNGNILYSLGNPSRLTLIRSTFKPAQALAILETGCFQKYGFDDADLALMCASHSSETSHLNRAREMLAKSNSSEDDFACGGHAAISEAVNNSWIRDGYSPTAICNNCSGKHAGMIAASKAIGAGCKDYHLPDHPMQLRVKEVFERLCGADWNKMRWGIDGCNLPAPAIPLSVLARVYASFAESAVSPLEEATDLDARKRLIFEAMSGYPELVGGENRFCTELMRAFNGLMIGKVGADACYAIGMKPSSRARQFGAQGSIGIAVKIEDGNLSILYSAVLEILRQLELLEDLEKYPGLGNFDMREVKNTAGVVTGNVSYDFVLQPATVI